MITYKVRMKDKDECSSGVYVVVVQAETENDAIDKAIKHLITVGRLINIPALVKHASVEVLFINNGVINYTYFPKDY